MLRRALLAGTAALAAQRALAQRVGNLRYRGGMQTYPSGTGAADGVLIYGQSNAGVGGSIATTYLSADFPAACVTAQFPYEQMFDIAVDPANAGGQLPLQNPVPLGVNKPLTVAVPAAFGLQQFQLDASQTPPVRWWFTVWAGGQPITHFMSGQTAYTNILLAANKIANVGPFFNPPPVPVKAVVWIQGETPSASYASLLTTLIGTLIPDIKAQTGQSADPKFIIFQTNNASNDATLQQVRLDQLSVAQTVAGSLMAGPMYYTPLQNEGAGNIHGTQEGRMMVGEILALAYKKQIVDGVAWNPLQPVSASRVGAVITIQFQLPPGGTNLALDTTWIQAATNYGFVYQDDSSSATIASVALGGDGTSVVITLNATPTGANKKILYAMGQPSDLVATWPGARGQLTSPTTQTSYFWRHGQAVPQFVKHYSVSFSQAVT